MAGIILHLICNNFCCKFFFHQNFYHLDRAFWVYSGLRGEVKIDFYIINYKPVFNSRKYLFGSFVCLFAAWLSFFWHLTNGENLSKNELLSSCLTFFFLWLQNIKLQYKIGQEWLRPVSRTAQSC